jgi:hypothetical protein
MNFKKGLLVLSFVTVGGFLFSQTNVYRPFPEQYGRWVIRIDNAESEINGIISYKQYQVSGDTTIGSYTYKKVNCANSSQPYSQMMITGLKFGQSTYNFAYRNDIPNKKVYIFTGVNGILIDTLWYNFNLNIGDTLKGLYSYHDSGAPSLIVAAIDSVNICNEYYKKYKFVSFDHNHYAKACLIEGVGFSANFIESDPFQFFPFEQRYNYSTDFYCSATAINETKAVKNQIKILPNPVGNFLQIQFSHHYPPLFLQYSIVDGLGKIIITGFMVDNKSIDVSKLENGLYILRLHDKEGNYFQDKFLKW